MPRNRDGKEVKVHKSARLEPSQLKVIDKDFDTFNGWLYKIAKYYILNRKELKKVLKDI